jgi:hypothetical protein
MNWNIITWLFSFRQPRSAVALCSHHWIVVQAIMSLTSAWSRCDQGLLGCEHYILYVIVLHSVRCHFYMMGVRLLNVLFYLYVTVCTLKNVKIFIQSITEDCSPTSICYTVVPIHYIYQIPLFLTATMNMALAPLPAPCFLAARVKTLLSKFRSLLHDIIGCVLVTWNSSGTP